MISIKNLNISYSANKPVIQGLNLELEDSNIHGIVGLNGSGKTTLLNTIFGIKKKGSGDITIHGENLSKKNIAFLETESYFFANITGYEYIRIFSNNNFDIDQWNKIFNLPLETIIDNYSTGMKKKLALLGVLKQNKSIIILDEPFNGLDLESVRIARSILLKLKDNGKTIIITSHILETLTNLCDKIHFLEDGYIKQSKAKDEFEQFEKDLHASIEEKNDRLISNLFLDK